MINDSKLANDLDFARSSIEKNLDVRQVNKVLHAFPSPRFWREKDIPLDSIFDERARLRSAGQAKPIDLYVAVPYCLKTKPTRCGYCLFPVEEFTGNDDLEVYFEYLTREAAMFKDYFRGERLGSLYFGGGTSNLYRPGKYPE